MKKLAFLAALVVAASCAQNAKTLTVGTNAEYHPFEYLDNGKVTGFDIELIGEVAKILSKEIKIENMSFDGLLPALQSKKIDLVIAGMASTEDRKKNVNFSEVYYQTQDQRLIVVSNNAAISNVASLKGKKAGVMLGFTSDTYLSAMPEIELSRFNGAGEAIMALKSGKIDAIMLDADPTRGYLTENPDLKDYAVENTAEAYAIALRKEDTVLLEQINKALAELRANGVYDTIFNKYFPKVN